MKKEKVEKIIFNKGMKNAATDSKGASGGLLVIQKDSFEVEII